MARDASNVRVALEDALQQFMTLPVKRPGSSDRFSSIDKVVLFGDAVDDPHLHEGPRDVLNQNLYGEVFYTDPIVHNRPQSAFDAA